MEGKTQEPMTVNGPLTPTASSYITKSDGKTPRYAWIVWIVTFLVSFAAPLGQFKLVSIPLWFIYVPGVSPEGGFMMDAAGFGMLMTVVSLIGIVLAFPAAFICRKLGLKNTILVATLGVIIGGIIPLVAGTNIPALYVGRFIEGLGIALTGVAAQDNNAQHQAYATPVALGEDIPEEIAEAKGLFEAAVNAKKREYTDKIDSLVFNASDMIFETGLR